MKVSAPPTTANIILFTAPHTTVLRSLLVSLVVIFFSMYFGGPARPRKVAANTRQRLVYNLAGIRNARPDFPAKHRPATQTMFRDHRWPSVIVFGIGLHRTHAESRLDEPGFLENGEVAAARPDQVCAVGLNRPPFGRQSIGGNDAFEKRLVNVRNNKGAVGPGAHQAAERAVEDGQRNARHRNLEDNHLAVGATKPGQGKIETEADSVSVRLGSADPVSE